MSLIGLGLLKQSVSPVEVVQHPQHPVALVEPGGERRVVKAGVLLSGLSYPTPVPTVLTTCVRTTQGIVAHSWSHSRLKTCHLPLESSLCDCSAHKSEPVGKLGLFRQVQGPPASGSPGTLTKMQISRPCSPLHRHLGSAYLEWNPRACI